MRNKGVEQKNGNQCGEQKPLGFDLRLQGDPSDGNPGQQRDDYDCRSHLSVAGNMHQRVFVEPELPESESLFGIMQGEYNPCNQQLFIIMNCRHKS